jgi:hypothetical protein
VRTRTLVIGTRRKRQRVYVARVRERDPSTGDWEPAQTLSSALQKVGAPSVGIDADGSAVAAWHWGTGTRPGLPGFVGQIQVAQGEPGAAWSAPRVVSGSRPCDEVRRPRVAVGAGGHAVVWWQCDLPGTRSIGMAVAREPGTPFGAARPLPFRTRGELLADLAVAPDGTAVAVGADEEDVLGWWRGPARAAGLTLQALPSAGSPLKVDRRAGRPSLAIDGSGDALTAWIDANEAARAASIAAGLGVASPITVSPPGRRIASLRTALGMGGDAVVAMVEARTGSVLAATRGADGVWAEAQRVTRTGGATPGDSPRVAVDGTGRAVAYWTRAGVDERFVARSERPAPVG